MSIPYFKYLKGTKFERSASALFFIIGIFGSILLFTSFTPFSKNDVKPFQFSDFQTDFFSVENSSIAQSNWRSKSNETPSFSLFDFDPNTASKEDFQKLGLSSKIANTIANFRDKNGKFFQPEDLKKIYGFRDEDYQRLENFIKIKGHKSFQKQEKNNFQNTNNQPIPELFEFNPNEASIEDFERLGLSSKLSKRIVKYRDKGGHFYQKEDLLKIYGFPEKTYKQLVDFILIPTEKSSTPIAQSTYPKKDFPTSKSSLPSIKIDINQATAEDWQQLRGIGPGYAKKIIGFRSKLGGFASANQVAEIYNFPDSVFQKIKPFLIESKVLTKIKINEITEEDLKMHPYFNWKQAKALIKYRRQHGNFSDLEDLKKIIGVFKTTDWVRIEPYVAF